MSVEYYSIGLERDELNRYFGGGIPQNSLIFIEGPDGGGKSVFCQRVAFSLLDKDASVTYVSTELNTLEFIRQTNSIEYFMKDYMLDSKLKFVTMVPFLGKTKYEENFIEKITKTPQLFETDIIIFDTLSFLLVKENAAEEEYYKIVSFFKKLNNLNKTVIFTMDPVHINEKFLTLLRNVSDVYISISLKEFGGTMVRALNVRRFKRPMDIYVSNIPFRVEPKTGLVIEIGGFA